MNRARELQSKNTAAQVSRAAARPARIERREAQGGTRHARIMAAE
eukprot:CAMPEP_0119165518 /NCGR_PEP_ID=MMETSP1315-20130426/5168_1 /TAXON_ID=676789 /ORGANISM="Prasinoderma singularis, Strain RCC927" /LENGTH=44 /DNA_ID= /DNA_START= /DNA_END= /DNA_ORIENTATION=